MAEPGAEGVDDLQGAPGVVEEADGTVRMPLTADDVSVTRARRYVQGRWPDLAEEVLDDVSIIVSELVSNAVVHGRPDIEMRLRVLPFAVDVAVLDHNPELPAPPSARPSPTQASGRGLLLVDRLARRWGVEPFPDGTGKTVWASIESP